jgi:vacuolar-type H+-ATPase catalytic subunit A/Vma1
MNRKVQKNVPLAAGSRCVDDAFPILVDGRSCGPGSGGASEVVEVVVVEVVVVERTTLNLK